MLAGARAAVGDAETPAPERPLARAVAALLREGPGAGTLGAGATGVPLSPEDLSIADEALDDWDAFLAPAAERAADRFAALACRLPLAALRALYRLDSVTAPGAAEMPERARRIGFLRTSRVRDLVTFWLSAAHARALGEATADGDDGGDGQAEAGGHGGEPADSADAADDPFAAVPADDDGGGFENGF